MVPLPLCRCTRIACLFLLALLAGPVRAGNLSVPPEAPAILEKIYSFDLEGATASAKLMQQERPKHPLGYLLEAEASWWHIWCTSAEFKYGMTDARRRPKREPDQHYLELAATASSLATGQLLQGESAEMQFYAGM